MSFGIAVSGHKVLSFSTMATLFAFSSAPALAQSLASPAAANPQPAVVTAEVVVTAERRGVNLQRLPISATAVTHKELAAKAIETVADLQRFTPSLSIVETGLQRFINIRGIGMNASLPQTQPGISYQVDGVFTRNLVNEAPYFDIDHIEVLRGPQGTLSGQSSTGGAIFVVTQQPVIGGTGGEANISYGNYDHITGDAEVSIPVSDTLALRAAVFTESRDSYDKILSPPGAPAGTTPSFHPGNLDRDAARLSLLWAPTNDLQVILRGEAYDRTSDGYAFKPTPGDPTAVFNGIAASTVAPANPLTIDYNTPGKADLQMEQASAEIKWYFAPNLELRSLTGYTNGISNSAYDQDGTGTLQVTGPPTNIRQLEIYQYIHMQSESQEFNLITTGNGPLQGVLGGYYYNYDSPNSLTNATITSITKTANLQTDAVFGQLTYKLTDQVQLVGGLRYNNDIADQSGGELEVRAAALPFAPVAPTSTTTSAVTGKAAINYEVTPDEFLYATVARGYKAGGYNSSGLPSFAPEIVWNYETGLKSKLFDGHLQTQVSAYYSAYQDFQINAYSPALNATYVQNVANADIYGAEFQAQARFGQLSFDGELSLLHSAFGKANGGGNILLADTRYNVGDPRRGPIDITGLRLPFAQNVTAAVGAQYVFPLEKGTLTPRIQYSYNGDQWATIFDKSYDYIPSRYTMDLRLTYAQDKWELAAFATNVTNQIYITGKFGGDDYYGAPREFGTKLSYKF